MIEVNGLVKTFGTTRAVDGISFSVNAGEVLGFLGPNGAGKTTTMKMLTCFLPPDAGSITVAGLDSRTGALAIREKIGYLPENTPLYGEMRVDEYLAFVADMRKVCARTQRIRDIVEITDISSVYMKNIDELSKGFRQRVGLAQALIHDPDILVLDEPTSGLDPNQILEIRKLIRELGKSKTVILSTHILQEVSAVCSRVLIINNGKIAANDTPENLQRAFSGAGTVILTVSADETALRAGLTGSDVLSIEQTGTDGRWNTFVLTSVDPDAPEKLFDLAVARGWKVKELHAGKASLEDVFLRLTSGNPGGDGP